MISIRKYVDKWQAVRNLMGAEIKCSQKDTKKMIEAVSNMDTIVFIYEPEYYKELYWRDIDMIYPEDQQIVLACGKLGAMRVVKAYIRTAKSGHSGEHSHCDMIIVGTGKHFNATHWMPLPGLPKKEEELND